MRSCGFTVRSPTTVRCVSPARRVRPQSRTTSGCTCVGWGGARGVTGVSAWSITLTILLLTLIALVAFVFGFIG